MKKINEIWNYLTNEEIDYYNTKKSFEDAWNDCPRGDWMLKAARILKIDKSIFKKASLCCANTIQQPKHNIEKAHQDFLHYRAVAHFIIKNAHKKGIEYSEDDKCIEAIEAFKNASYNYDIASAFYDVNKYDNSNVACHTALVHATKSKSSFDFFLNLAAYHVCVVDFHTYKKHAVCFYNSKEIIENFKETAGICKKILTDKILN